MSILKDLKQQYILGGVTEKLIYWNVALFAIPWILTGVLTIEKMITINKNLLRNKFF